MALTYLATSMIETPTVFPQLSVTSLNVNTITSSPSVLGDLTIYGSLTALSGFNVVIASTTSTSALSVSNIQMTPALEVYQGPAGQVIAVFKNQAGDIVTVKDTGLTVSGIVSASNAGSSDLWYSVYTTTLANSANWTNVYTTVVGNSSVFTNVQSNSSVFTNVQSNSSVFTNVQSNSANWTNAYTNVQSNSANWTNAYTNVQSNSANWTNAYTNVQSNSANWQSTYLTVSALSASWEESADILPTVTNYLSTSNILLSGLTVTRDISTSGAIKAANTWPNSNYFVLTADGPIITGAVIMPVVSGGQLVLQPNRIYDTTFIVLISSYGTVGSYTNAISLSGDNPFTIINGFFVNTQTNLVGDWIAIDFRNFGTNSSFHTGVLPNPNTQSLTYSLTMRLSSANTTTVVLSVSSSSQFVPRKTSRYTYNIIG